ncbi:MerR family transcriptional regulator (plasmid) [Bacillus carboniphilus]|uniref:MerR family transcriptional regulator n=1 Tax=Bacillus carboniphilus TaxID=86663 RepID=A0ABY9JYF4_9BACI|nr:MerR family transcriptional regulator [Bacillus carboniphilus]WLR44436.1 MerR family transcriptional regulator [Bacillus carboniphilus]
MDLAYTTKEVASTLDIGESTLRKWSVALEKGGYPFIKNDKGYRSYLERDIIVLRKFKELVKVKSVSLESATELVMARVNEESLAKGTGVALSLDSLTQERSLADQGEINKELLEHFRKQEEVNKRLVEMIQEQGEMIKNQQNYIDERLNKHDQMLVQSMRDNMETRKQIAAAEEPKKGFWGKLFGR